MRATALGLAAAVLLSAGLLAHADPYVGYPSPAPIYNSSFYASNGPAYYGPYDCFRGPCLPPAPFNGILPLPVCQYAKKTLAGFPTHPFAHSPRDYFMYGQTHND
jgi:hypothetical protein